VWEFKYISLSLKIQKINPIQIKMENPTLVKDFNDVMTFIRQQEKRIKNLEKKIKDLEEENKKLKEIN